MENIKIASTSYLVPKNQEWKKIEKLGKISFGNYGNLHSDVLSFYDHHFLGAIFFDDIYDNNLQKFKSYLSSLIVNIKKRLNSSQKILIIGICSNYDDNVVRTSKSVGIKKKISDRILYTLYKLAKIHQNFYIIDLDKEFSKHGTMQVFDLRNWYYAHCRLSSLGLKILTDSFQKIILRYRNSSFKLLALDCDNTIWGGVIGEDGLNNLEIGSDGIGKIFFDFQKIVKNLIHEGVIVSLVSKNNEQDVWNVFKNHQGMFLKRKDVISSKINWNSKSENIKKICNELDIGLNSVVFWDDNPLERDQMLKVLPEVHTVNVPKEVHLWPNLLKSLFEFSKFSYTKEDKKKLKQYKSREKFVKDSDSIKDIKKYLKQIALRPNLISISNSNLLRAEQLCLKTNQFNLRTIRYSAKELESFRKSKIVYLSQLKDNYGDHGIIGLFILQKINREVIFIEQFLMSCRILGRYFDSWMLDQIRKIAKKNKFKYVVGSIIENTKNIVAREFFKNHKFSPLKKRGDLKKFFKSKEFKEDKLYFIELKNYQTPNMDIYYDKNR